MARFGIFHEGDSTPFYEGTPTFNGTYMKPGMLEYREIASPTPIDWAVGDYVDYSRTGMRYRLYQVPQVKRQSRNSAYGGAFLYQNVQLYDDSYQLQICPFRDLVPGDNRIHFSTQPSIAVFDNVAGIAERLQACLEDMYGTGSWVVRTVRRSDWRDPSQVDEGLLELIEEEKEFVVSGVTVLEVLNNKIYELWPEVGWVFRIENGVNTIIIGGGGIPDQQRSYEYGKGRGLTALTRTVVNADELANRLYVYGSSRNMLSRWYNKFDIKDAESVDIQNLMIPISHWGLTDDLPDPAKAFVESSGVTGHLRPRTVYFDGSQDIGEIYPSIKGMTIADVWARKGSVWEDTEYIPSHDIYTGTERIDQVLSAPASFDSGLAGNTPGTTYVEETAFSFNVPSGSTLIPAGSTRTMLFYWQEHYLPTETGALNLASNLFLNGEIHLEGITSATLSYRVRRSEAGGGFITGEDVELYQSSPGVFAIRGGNFNANRVLFTGSSCTLEMEIIVGYEASDEDRTCTFNYEGSLSLYLSKYRAETFTIGLRQLGFSIEQQAALGSGKTIAFTSGKCSGRSFAIKSCSYVESTDSWALEVYRSEDESLAQWFPNTDYPVETGDTFVLLDIAMPKLYIGYAEERLYQAALDLLAFTEKEVWQYTPEIDAKFMVENGRTITPAEQIRIVDADIVDGSGLYVVDSVTINEGEATIPTYKITLRNRKKKTYSESAPAPTPSSKSVGNAQSAIKNLSFSDINGELPAERISGLDEYLYPIAEALYSFQSQIDAVSARNNYDELTATVLFSEQIATSEIYAQYAHAERYYLTDSIYFYTEIINNQVCVRLNAPFITSGDQIVIDGEPGGGGGGGGSQYLHELLDVTITNPANGQALVYRDGVWVNENIATDLTNYYTKSEVDALIGAIEQFHYEIYPSTSAVTNPQSNVLYLIGPTGSGSDKYEEYVYANGAWTKIGDTSIDLSGYVQTSRLDADEAILSEAIQSFQSQIDAVSARNNFDELTATSFYADMLAATYAYAERYYLTDDVYFSIEKVNNVACVRLNAPFITDGDQIIISGTPGSGGGGSGVTLYDYTQVKAMTADVALTAPSAWAMHQMWAEIFGGASAVLTSGNYTNYVNTTNFPGLDKIGTVTSVATGTGLTGGPITSAGVISIDPTYLGYITHGETAYGWGDILTQAMQSFQSQIDSVSARDTFDELTATALYADTGAISALYAGSIELDGEDLATAVSGIRGRLTSVENKFDADGSALSAVRLKTARTLWGQNFDGTANVVGNMTSVGSIDASGLIKTTNYAQAQRFYLTDSIYFYTETIDGVACVMLNAPFVTSGDQIIISGTPGGGGQGVGYLYELEDVSDALASPTNGMVLYYDGTEWIGKAATEIGGVTSVAGKTGAVVLVASDITNIEAWVSEKGYLTSAAAAITYVTKSALASDEAIISQAIQSLQSQVDSVSARDEFDELTATVLFADTLSASDAYIDNITGSLSGNAATASRLVGASYNVGNVNKPVYFSGGLPVETTYAIYAALFSGTAGRLAYYNTANLVSDYTGNVGSATQPMHLVAGVPTACTYTLGAALLAATTAGKLAYYSGTNSVSSYTSTIGSGVIPMYLNAGVPTASTSTVGSAALPVYLNGGTITACSGASIFSQIGSNTVNNLELTIAGQLRTATLYATYDNAGENISDKFGIVGQAIQSLQSQVDSVSARNSFDEVVATVGFIDTLSVGDAVYSAKGCIAQYLTVGQTSIATSYPLYVVGVIASTGDQVVTSDATKKTNLKDIALSVGQIASAPAVTFDWKSGGHSFGSIAQYWRNVLPESVLGDEGDYSLAYAQLALVSAINIAKHETEQDKEIRELKKKVARLENEVKRLRN